MLVLQRMLVQRRGLPAAFAGLAGFAAAPPGCEDAARANDDVLADLLRLILEAGCLAATPAEPDVIRFQLHGEERLRHEHLRSFPLDPTETLSWVRPT
jgi:hypothetical protein